MFLNLKKNTMVHQIQGSRATSGRVSPKYIGSEDCRKGEEND